MDDKTLMTGAPVCCSASFLPLDPAGDLLNGLAAAIPPVADAIKQWIRQCLFALVYAVTGQNVDYAG